MSARAFRETIADGRHEWQRAATGSARLLAGARLIGALARVLVFVTWADARKAAGTSLVRHWLLGTTVASALLWIVNPLLQRGRTAPHFYLVDLGEIFVLLAMPVFLLLSLARRRESAVPVLGTVAVVLGTFLVWLFVLIPLGLPARYAIAYHGRLYSPVPWFIAMQWIVVTIAFTWAAIGLTDRVVVHDRRPFLTVLSLLVPGLLIALIGRNQDVIRHVTDWHVVPFATFAVAAAAGLAILWAGLKWESHSDLRGTMDAIR